MKKIMSVVSWTLVCCMMLTQFSFAVSIDKYSDVSGHWAYDSLHRAAEKNVIVGSSGKLSPNGTLTNAEVVTMLVRARGLQNWDDLYAGTSTSDWYYIYAAIAGKAGILPEDGSIGMKAAASREQVFQAFVNAYFPDEKKNIDENADTSVLSKFSDGTQVSAGNSKATAFLVAGGVAGGNDKGLLSPKAGITRAEFVTIMLRINDNYDSLRNIAQSLEKVSKDDTDDTQTEPAESDSQYNNSVVSDEKNTSKINDVSDNKNDTDMTADSQNTDTTADSQDPAAAEPPIEEPVITAPADAGIFGMKINMSSQTVQPGGKIQIRATFSDVKEAKVCGARWICDNQIDYAYSSDAKTVAPDADTTFNRTLTFTKNMPLYHIVGLNISYHNQSTGKVENVYSESFVEVTNYDASHYAQLEKAEQTAQYYSKALATVSSKYKGNYKSSYNPDYSTQIKEAFVNGKGYSSKTNYLVWANLGTQKVNVYLGSAGNWSLVKTMRCASGAPSSPTPTGVTYVTYKQNGWFNSSYVCKPVVRFYPGTGYAFHSILYKADGVTIKDGSIGFPVSHGCLRMLPADIQWLYNYVPVNTTVVIY